ncbi:MAG: hypothetical protein ACTSSG_01950 [Candidatus Heimdallarchaeaceae archaeon]
MKVIFQPEDIERIYDDLKKIAAKYGTIVQQQEEGENHFLFIQSRIKIAEKGKNKEKLIHVWGAKEEDIIYLQQFWGEPLKKITQKPTPQDFAKELSRIPDVQKLSKKELLTLMEISERDLEQYYRFLKRFSTKPNSSDQIKRAATILENLQ